MNALDLPWMKSAYAHLGVHEGTDLKANPLVLRFFQEAGHGEVKNDHRTPWCAAFVGAMLAQCGIKPTGTLWALDYARWGQKLAGPLVGAVGYKRRQGGGGHVFFIASFDARFVYALGGNQNDQVCISRIPRAQVAGYRWPPGVAIPSTPPAAVSAASVAHATEA